MTDSVREDLSTSHSAVSATLRSLSSYAAERLTSDDQVLEVISRLSSQGIRQEETVKVDSKTVEQWCRSLVACRTAEIKARIDVIYKSKLLEAIENGTPNKDGIDGTNGKDALQAELETLREEIAPVSEMVVENDLRNPVVTSIERSTRDKVRSSREWNEYVSAQQFFPEVITHEARCSPLSTTSQPVSMHFQTLCKTSTLFMQQRMKFVMHVVGNGSSPPALRQLSGPCKPAD